MGLTRRLLGQAVKATAAAVDVVRRPPSGIVVLIYHRVGGGTISEIDLPVERFGEQMAWLAEHCRPVTLDGALDELTDSSPPSGSPAVAVTFDDGTADFTEHAVPVLERHKLPATLYVATEFIEEQRQFPAHGHPASWNSLGEALATGLVTIGSHTHTHALLDRLPDLQVAGELDRSIDLIGERLGVTAGHFAYPKAVAGSVAARRAVEERFRSAALAGTLPNPYGDTDPHHLARTPVQVSDGRTWFRRKVAGGMATEDDLRRLLNRQRYGGATT